MSNFVILSGATPWSSTATIKQKPVRPLARCRASAKNTQLVVNPIFLILSELTDDMYWKNLFFSTAKGDLPRGFRYQNGILSHRIRTKSSEVFIDVASPHLAFIAAKTFFVDKGRSLGSEKDFIIQKKLESEKAPSEIVIDNWTKIRGNKTKQITVAYYIDELCTTMKLNEEQCLNLSNVIWIGILANYFNNTTIKIVEGKIVSIDGLKNKEDKTFYIEIDKKSTKKCRKYVDEETLSLTSHVDINAEDEMADNKHRPVISTAWISFLKNWEKKKRI